MPARILLTLAFVLVAFAARADGEILSIITKHDRTRLDNYETTREKAVEEAATTDSKADLTKFREILDRPKLSFQGFDMTGEWQCRTIKAGGLVPLVIYDWFRCRVTDDGSGWMLEKLSGSQRTKGRFFTDSDTRLTYLGSYFVAGDEQSAYGSGPETDQAGYTFRGGEQHWRIEFPAPARESILDILEFRR